LSQEDATIAIDFSLAFFDLQLRFAERVAHICSLSFEEGLLTFTNLYLQFIDRSFDPAHPIWQEYLEGLQKAQDPAKWTCIFYQTRREDSVSSHPEGCFRYVYLAQEKTLRLHFAANNDSSGYGPLSKVRISARLQELRALFVEVKRQHPDALVVRGNSWLYNIDAYKRLFPPQYTKTMRIVDEEFQYLSLWGQFVRRNGQVREDIASSFLSDLCKQDTLEGLKRCFPYQVMGLEYPITYFYEFYEYSSPPESYI